MFSFFFAPILWERFESSKEPSSGSRKKQRLYLLSTIAALILGGISFYASEHTRETGEAIGTARRDDKTDQQHSEEMQQLNQLRITLNRALAGRGDSNMTTAIQDNEAIVRKLDKDIDKWIEEKVTAIQHLPDNRQSVGEVIKLREETEALLSDGTYPFIDLVCKLVDTIARKFALASKVNLTVDPQGHLPNNLYDESAAQATTQTPFERAFAKLNIEHTWTYHFKSKASWHLIVRATKPATTSNPPYVEMYFTDNYNTGTGVIYMHFRLNDRQVSLRYTARKSDDPYSPADTLISDTTYDLASFDDEVLSAIQGILDQQIDQMDGLYAE